MLYSAMLSGMHRPGTCFTATVTGDRACLPEVSHVRGHCSSVADGVAEVDDAVREGPFADQLRLQLDAVGQRSRSTSDYDGRDEEVKFVDEAGCERLPGEVRSADGQVAIRDAFSLSMAAGSKDLLIWVRSLETSWRVVE